ncbi:DUF3108 domain-containing protein [Ekhidna sp.]
MKNYLWILTILLFACQPAKEEKASEKKWLGQTLNLSEIQPTVNTYHMLDTSGAKVGSMIFGTYFENGKLVVRDTSSFDNGSVYEEAEFAMDTATYQSKQELVRMQINTTRLDVNIVANNKQVNGMYTVTRDTTATDYPVDSLYSYDVFRTELYMLMQALDYKKDDTIKFKSLVSTSMTVSDASLYYVNEEQITTAAGTFDCNVIHLMTDGKMPQNRVWITKSKPSKIVKFYVPGADLSIELVESRSNE